MKKPLFITFILILLMGTTSCTSYMDKPKVHFTHGLKLQDRFISIVNFTPEEIEFKIRRGARQKYLYFVILDEEEERISEGWFPTQHFTGHPDHYTVKMKTKEGFSLQPGKSYRLCAGASNPDAYYYYSNNYKCFIDYTFKIL